MHAQYPIRYMMSPVMVPVSGGDRRLPDDEPDIVGGTYSAAHGEAFTSVPADEFGDPPQVN
jgi:hypothetical protein